MSSKIPGWTYRQVHNDNAAFKALFTSAEMRSLVSSTTNRLFNELNAAGISAPETFATKGNFSMTVKTGYGTAFGAIDATGYLKWVLAHVTRGKAYYRVRKAFRAARDLS